MRPQAQSKRSMPSLALRSVTPYSLNKLKSKIESVLRARTSTTIADLIEKDLDPAKHVVFRFDVERRPQHALNFAKELDQMGARATMYFHTRKNCYDAQVMREIQELNFEVGYHHECLDRCRGNFSLSRDLFTQDIQRMRADGLNIRTVCSHGEVGITKSGYNCNWELFNQYPQLLSQNNLLGEVYIQMPEKFEMVYATDTFAGYSSFWGQIDKAQHSDALLQVLIHPHRWHETAALTFIEAGKDLVQRYSNKIKKTREYQTPWAA